MKQKTLVKITKLLTGEEPPELILNRHCQECEYHHRCRENAILKDDLSLLGGMTERERKKLNSKGIFSIKQLSYTFRPRRRPKSQRHKREKYHHSLRALALRENKTHLVASPKLKFEGTPVYLDVEGLQDDGFYYLVGLRYRKGDSVVQHSLWADTIEEEEGIWRNLLELLSAIDSPLILHYGSYETTFINTMIRRYGALSKGSHAEKALTSAINILSSLYGYVYFPVLTNGLKESAGYCGFRWSEALTSGLFSVVWRKIWENNFEPIKKAQLIKYNAEDCEALDVLTQKILSLQLSYSCNESRDEEFEDVTKMKREDSYVFKKNVFELSELESINKAAYWNYQREKVYLKSNNYIKRGKFSSETPNKIPPNKIIECKQPKSCPTCSSKEIYAHGKASKKVIDLKFTHNGIKRWVVRYNFHRYICRSCGVTFYPKNRSRNNGIYGSGIIAYSLYQCIDLNMPTRSIDKNHNKIFGLNLTNGTTSRFKSLASKDYEPTYKNIITKICNGDLIHVDETRMNVNDQECYVWVIANMDEVAYIATKSREGEFIQYLLKDFRGVLVSDFYAVYDSIKCPQQKCLIHLIRDINDTLYKNPYDEGLKHLAKSFTALLQAIIETVGRFGLKKYYLKKHIRYVDRFYRMLIQVNLVTDTAVKLKERLEKNRRKLFTFLEYDGIPWNNNNAEHAVKPFAILRNVMLHLINSWVTSGSGRPPSV